MCMHGCRCVCVGMDLHVPVPSSFRQEKGLRHPELNERELRERKCFWSGLARILPGRRHLLCGEPGFGARHRRPEGCEGGTGGRRVWESDLGG